MPETSIGDRGPTWAVTPRRERQEHEMKENITLLHVCYVKSLVELDVKR